MVLRYLDRLDDLMYRKIVDRKRELNSILAGGYDLLNLEHVLEVEFVYNTNSLEGNTLSFGETEMVLKGMTVSGKSLSDIQEVRNHPAAIEFIRSLAFSKDKKIVNTDILRLHGIIFKDVLAGAGKYREDDNITVRGASFVPAPWHEILSDMEELLQFVNNNPDHLSPIEVATHIHFWFVRIHPFHDGNGRVARLLTNFVLLRSGYPFIIFKKVESNQYLRCLHKADDGQFKPFLVYVTGLLKHSLDTYILASGGGNRAFAEGRLETLTELAKGTPYSADYLRVLANRGAIDAVKQGRSWKTTRKIINSYMEQHQ